MPQINVYIKAEEGKDKQEIDSLAHSLRDDLLNLEVEEVHLLHEKAPPPAGSKGVEKAAIGSMIVDSINGSIIKEVTQTVQAWIKPNENCAITIEMADGQKRDVKGISSRDQQKIIDAWVMHQIQKMMSV